MVRILKSLNHDNITDEEINAYYSLRPVKNPENEYNFNKQLTKIITEYIDTLPDFKTDNAKRSYKRQLKEMITKTKPSNSMKYKNFITWRLKQINIYKSKQRDWLMSIGYTENADTYKKQITELSNALLEKDKQVYSLMAENKELREKLKKYENVSMNDTEDKYDNENVIINDSDDSDSDSDSDSDDSDSEEEEEPIRNVEPKKTPVQRTDEILKENGYTTLSEYEQTVNEMRKGYDDYGIPLKNRKEMAEYGNKIIKELNILGANVSTKKQETARDMHNLERHFMFLAEKLKKEKVSVEDTKKEEPKPEPKKEPEKLEITIKPTTEEEYKQMKDDKERIHHYWKKIDDCIEQVEELFITKCDRNRDMITDLSNLFYDFHTDHCGELVEVVDLQETMYKRVWERPFSVLEDNLNRQAK